MPPAALSSDPQHATIALWVGGIIISILSMIAAALFRRELKKDEAWKEHQTRAVEDLDERQTAVEHKIIRIETFHEKNHGEKI